jgi:hypothetical protein
MGHPRGRPRIGDHAMTSAERQQRHREMLSFEVHPEQVITAVVAQLDRLRRGVEVDQADKALRELAAEIGRRRRDHADELAEYQRRQRKLRRKARSG